MEEHFAAVAKGDQAQIEQGSGGRHQGESVFRLLPFLIGVTLPPTLDVRRADDR